MLILEAELAQANPRIWTWETCGCHTEDKSEVKCTLSVVMLSSGDPSTKRGFDTPKRTGADKDIEVHQARRLQDTVLSRIEELEERFKVRRQEEVAPRLDITPAAPSTLPPNSVSFQFSSVYLLHLLVTLLFLPLGHFRLQGGHPIASQAVRMEAGVSDGARQRNVNCSMMQQVDPVYLSSCVLGRA